MTCALSCPCFFDTMTRILVRDECGEYAVCEGVLDAEISRARGSGLVRRMRLCSPYCTTLLGCAWSLLLVGNTVRLRALAFFGGET